MCLYPRLVRNPKYKANKKNGGNVPHMHDARVGQIPVGCGVCMECLTKKSNEWRVRLKEDIKNHKNGKFITLTFNNETYTEIIEEAKKQNSKLEGYDLDNQVATIAVRKFLERWRKKHGKSVRHWLVTELGHTGTEHLHIHGIIWCDDVEEIDKIWNSDKKRYGYTWLGHMKYGKRVNYVNEKTINYIIKYVTKVDVDHKYYKPKVLTSPGIGNKYVETFNAGLNKYKGIDTKETYTTEQGHKIGMPMYWRNKIYTEEEREQLWLQKLDKGVQWIGGIKVKAEDAEGRSKLLKVAQEKNTRLGYGSPGDWDAKKYEKERRKLKQEERIIKKEEIIVAEPRWEKTEWKEPGLDDW